MSLLRSQRRVTVMEKIENILYSIVPLILIILFSWLFSFLGSKMRKQQPDEAVPEQEKGRDFRLIDLLTDQTEPPQTTDSRTAPLDWRGAEPGSRPPVQQSPTIPAGPQVTPRPIRPKWWGA
jgi:hypothetical protein